MQASPCLRTSGHDQKALSVGSGGPFACPPHPWKSVSLVSVRPSVCPGTDLPWTLRADYIWSSTAIQYKGGQCKWNWQCGRSSEAASSSNCQAVQEMSFARCLEEISCLLWSWNLQRPPLYMGSVIKQNVARRHTPVLYFHESYEKLDYCLGHPLYIKSLTRYRSPLFLQACYASKCSLQL